MLGDSHLSLLSNLPCTMPPTLSAGTDRSCNYHRSYNLLLNVAQEERACVELSSLTELTNEEE